MSVKGDAFVAREGRLVRAKPAMAVRTGDRVITRANASADVLIDDCSINLADSEMDTLGTSCGSIESASSKRAASASNGSTLLGSNAGGGIFAGLGAVVLIVLAVVVATRNNTRPTSP